MERRKILIVDDIPENIEVLSRCLIGDYDVMYDKNGADALNRARSVRPDLILLDIMMPDMNGFEVCRRLKMDEELKNIPVIFLTALTDEFDEVEGFDYGAVDFITKPYKPLAVKKRVSFQLALKQQRDLLEQSNLEQKEALARIRTLSGLLPICMMCKKIRDDKGYWSQLEVYLTLHSNAMFSHGLCPECAEEYTSKLKEEGLI